MFEFSEWSRLWPRQLSEEGVGIRRFLLYSGCDQRLCLSIYDISVVLLYKYVLMPPITFYSCWQKFISEVSSPSFWCKVFIIFLLNWQVDMKGKPLESWETIVYDFFSPHVLNGSAYSESRSSPFFLKISSGLNEFTLIGI